MFTGITTHRITIRQVDSSHDNESRVLHIDRPKGAWELGDSILLNGICTTITALDDESITVGLIPETVRLTTASDWQSGDVVNSEPPLTLETKLSGSIVSGHVDAVGTVVSVIEQGDEYGVTVSYPEEYGDFVVIKGGITIDGVNLTVTDRQPNQCTVQLIPYTRTETTLGQLQQGDAVNLEFDYFAKLTIQHLRQR